MLRFLLTVPLAVASCATSRRAADPALPVRTIRGVRGNVALDPAGEVTFTRTCPLISGTAFDDGHGMSTEDDVWTSVDGVLKGRFTDSSQESLRPIREALFKSMKEDVMRPVQLDARPFSNGSLIVEVGAGGSYSGSAVVMYIIKVGDGYDVKSIGMRSWSCVTTGSWIQRLHGTVAVDDVRDDNVDWLVGVFDLSGTDAPWDASLDAPSDGISVHAKGSFRIDVAQLKDTLPFWVAEDMMVVNQSQ